MDENASVNLFSRFENQVLFATPQRDPVPVSLITGALGAGCTSLLKHILHNKRNLVVTAIVNDFAAVNIDEKLVKRSMSSSASTSVAVHELSNGCMCCVASLGNRFDDVIGRVLGDGDSTPDLIAIETSGVTDPLHVITKLERTFGPTTRCRLDSVVCVVDCDAVASALDADESFSASTMSQIRCADVVIINKVDLVPQEHSVDAVHAFVETQAPGARVLRATFAAVPLHLVLDIEPPTSVGQVVSHEAAPQLALSLRGGALRRQWQQQQQPRNVGTSTHLRDDEFVASVFESCGAPLRLHAFQDWLANLPPALARVKGVVWFHCQRALANEFQLSGRRRLYFERGLRWSSPPSVCLAIIGKSLDCEAVRDALQAVCDAAATTGDHEQSAASIKAVLGQSRLLEVLDDVDMEQQHGVVTFRLVGTSYLGMSRDTLEVVHGVDVNAMNVHLLRSLNACGKPGVFFISTLVHQAFYLQWACGGRLRFADIEPTLLQVALDTLKRWCGHIPACSCGA